jgi:hypothetical protein
VTGADVGGGDAPLADDPIKKAADDISRTVHAAFMQIAGAALLLKQTLSSSRSA